MYNAETQRITVSEDKVRGELVYKLLTDAITLDDKCIIVYGVSVEFTNENGIEMYEVRDVTSDRDEMINLISRMRDGMVFPVGLIDIVEDFIA